MQLALQITLVVTSVLVVLLVLLHRAKGGGLSTLFGGGVQSSLSGSTVVEKNLDRLRCSSPASGSCASSAWPCWSNTADRRGADSSAGRPRSASILEPMVEVSDSRWSRSGPSSGPRSAARRPSRCAPTSGCWAPSLVTRCASRTATRFRPCRTRPGESFRVRHSEIDRAEMSRMFDGIDIHLAIPVIRAFSHFALLANVAEDIHRERRRRIHVAAGEPPQDSSLAATYAKLDQAELDSATVADALQGALVSPVITAHPTETRRRTVFVTQHRITELMRLHADGHTETSDGRSIERELRRQVLTLWQTALIRLSRLKISDEIEVGLRYYPAALFTVIPQVNADVRGALRARWPDADLLSVPMLRPGSWIGGDRDGNPNVTADVVRLATGSAAFTALAHYLAELSDLEQELSMSARLVAFTPELACAGRRLPGGAPAPTSRTGGRYG